MFVPDPTPRVSVVGSGKLDVQPDRASVTIGVYVLDPALRKAKASSDTVVARLFEVTRRMNLAAGDVSSSVISVEPKYSEAEAPDFLGYEVSRSVNIDLSDLSSLDRLIDDAIEAGANRDISVTFLLQP
jgi:uncharacterized protein YggE